MSNTTMAIAGIVVILIIVGIAYFALYSGSPSAPSGSSTTTASSTTSPTTVASNSSTETQANNSSTQSTQGVPVFVTDPPTVPAGTQSLVLTYSQVKVQTAANATAGASSQWITAQGSGQIDLIALVNSSQVVGYVTLPVNTTVSAIALTVTNATIVVNGTAHTVALASNNISSAVSNSSAKVNAQGGILLDISPTVNATYTPAGFNTVLGVYESNATTTYSMSTSTKAAVLVNLNASVNVGVGGIVKINGATAGLVSIT